MIGIARTTGWLAGLLFCIATAAHGQVLITNLANPTNGGYGGGPDSSDNFTTGAVGLTITSVNVEWSTGFGGVNRVGIYTDNAGQPSTTQVGGFFTNPNPTTAGTTMTYNGSATLAANTTYWMVVDIGDASDVSYTLTNTFTANAITAGATMPAGSAWGDNTVLGSWNADPAQLKFALVGVLGAPAGAALPAPTLQEWALIVLALLMAVIAAQRLRRPSPRRSARAPRY
jgi:hypothetical protein